MTTTTNPSNLFIDIMELNSKCKHERVFNATSTFIYHITILENELILAFEDGTLKKENQERIYKIMTAIEDMDIAIPASE